VTKVLENAPFHRDEIEDERYDKIIVLFPFGGRIDQTLSSMHNFAKVVKENDFIKFHTDIILMDSTSIMQYLPPGKNHIKWADEVQSPKGCGVIPLQGKWDSIKTKGLRWNMGNSSEEFSSLEFGGEIISTSNEIEKEEILIEVTHPVMWTTTLKYFYNNKEF
jgi:thiamine pyrophosphokinase